MQKRSQINIAKTNNKNLFCHKVLDQKHINKTSTHFGGTVTDAEIFREKRIKKNPTNEF